MWYYNLNNQPAGPVDVETLKSLFARGFVNSSTLVWQEGMPVWKQLGATELAKLMPEPGNPLTITNQSLEQSTKISRSRLKSLYIWWLVTLGFFPLTMIINMLPNLTSMKPDSPIYWFITGLVCFLEIPVFVSSILQYILLYHFWKNIQDGFTSTTAGKAVGFLFIPFFNIYWFFRAYWGLSKDQNKYIDRNFSGNAECQPRRSKGWLSLSYPIVTFAGGLIVYILFFIIVGWSVASGDISAKLTQTNDISSTMSIFLPILIISFTYFFVQIGLQIAMFVDFYLTSDSILKAEGQQ